MFPLSRTYVIVNVKYSEDKINPGYGPSFISEIALWPRVAV